MAKDTYEFGTANTKIETFEWDDLWYEQTANTDKRRVLYIGDSISRRMRGRFSNMSGGALAGDGYATSKALDNPNFLPMIKIAIAQEPRVDLLLFNNGLHGWHLNADEYERCYETAVKEILSLTSAPVYIVLSTSIAGERDELVKERNRRAEAVAERYGLRVIDLYTVSAENKELLSADGVHFTSEGDDVLARFLVDQIK